MTPFEELFLLADKLDEMASSPALDSSEDALSGLEKAATNVGQAFSGSWLGYHARVYYRDLQVPPPGAHFSQEWGLMDMSYTSLGSRGDWVEYESSKLVDCIRAQAGNPDLTAVSVEAAKAERAFEDAKASIKSVIFGEDPDGSDKFLVELLSNIDEVKPAGVKEAIEHWMPKGQVMTRDTVVLGQGNQVPPHILIKAEVAALRHSFGICTIASQIARKAASHIERKARRHRQDARVGTNVFIGHGHSPAWRELKDFVQDRLHLPWDEFNRLPVAGITNQARLSEMLDAAAVAFIIMTAEDQTAEGAMQARMNVIHEVGLFQGRLGFTKAIVLVEEGCDEFSNIHGLGQVRFPKDKISSAFEEIRRVLERENVISD